jgi:predicted nucleic acid-binding Zn ribbon protein
MTEKNIKNNSTRDSSRPRMDREKRRTRTMSYIFLGISVILILSMVLSAISR